MHEQRSQDSEKKTAAKEEIKPKAPCTWKCVFWAPHCHPQPLPSIPDTVLEGIWHWNYAPGTDRADRSLTEDLYFRSEEWERRFLQVPEYGGEPLGLSLLGFPILPHPSLQATPQQKQAGRCLKPGKKTILSEQRRCGSKSVGKIPTVSSLFLLSLCSPRDRCNSGEYMA